MNVDRLINFIVDKRHKIEKVFIAIIIFSCIAFPFVGINYDLTTYLPESADSDKGLKIMEEEFGYPGTARIMISDVSLNEAKVYKDKIANVDGVDMVLWADSKTNVYGAKDYIDYKDIDDYYKDNCAIMDVTFDESDSSKKTNKALTEIEKITGEKGHFAGLAPQNKSLAKTLLREVSIILVVGVLIIFLILCFSTTSWVEPFLFLAIMGIAIIINMGTNIFLGQVSFITFSVAAVLQLAIAMDYSIFLLHSFNHEVQKGIEKEQAMKNGLKLSYASILSSGATTIVGFIVLLLMQFTIGRDIGIVLAKGIVISLFVVLMLMPSLILKFSEKIDEKQHRSFMPSFEPLAKIIYNRRKRILIFVLLISIPAFTAQTMNSFEYGNGSLGSSEGTKVYDDEKLMNKTFGRSNLMIAIVPNTSIVSEKKLSDEIDDLYYTKSVTSLAKTLPDGTPENILPESVRSNLHTDKYARILISTKTDDESELAFKSFDEIKSIMKKYYPEDSYIVGATPSTIDIKNTINHDYSLVNLLSILGVALVIYFTYKALIIPIVVVIPIEIAIFMNMALPYIYGTTMMFMGYLVVSCIQLGATVDYSILLTGNYLKARDEKCLPTGEAAIDAVATSAASILTSGMILTMAGYAIYFISSINAIADIGRLVGRGALFSLFLVVGLLPVLLVMFDKQILNQQKKHLLRAQAFDLKKEQFKEKFMEEHKEEIEKFHKRLADRTTKIKNKKAERKNIKIKKNNNITKGGN